MRSFGRISNVHCFSLWLLSIFLPLSYSAAFAADDVPAPVATDSRIKTFVYSENDVFNIVTHYGYESNIEFGAEEEIQTISMGDRVPFQVTPSGRRLFIRAMTSNAHTNMTVVTNKHAYQFDVIAVPAPVMPNEELVYVVRFFYPSDKKNELSAQANMSQPMVSKPYNYKYTYTGSNQIVPLKIFDDGKSTYFKLRNNSGLAPSVYSVDDAGREVALVTHMSGDYLAVDVVSPRFYIRAGDYMVAVYNGQLYSN